MSNHDLELQLEMVVNAQYERMSHPAKLDLAGIKHITELVAQGFLLNTGKRSSTQGILNVIGVTSMAFNKWLLNQSTSDRDDLNTALLTQSMMLKQTMLETALDAVQELGNIAECSDSDKDKMNATNMQGTTALKILGVLDKEHQKMEKEAPPVSRDVQANIISSDSERERLQQLRELHNE